MDSDFFDGLGFGGESGKEVVGVGEKRPGSRHGHSNSMDGFGTASFEVDSVGLVGVDGVKKAMAPDRLAELALIDPKRAKRFLLFFAFPQLGLRNSLFILKINFKTIFTVFPKQNFCLEINYYMLF